MKQTRLESLIEIFANYAIGYAIAYLTYKYLVDFIFGIESTHAQAHGVTLLFTAISIVRSYMIRRFFNARLHKLAHSMAKGLVQ